MKDSIYQIPISGDFIDLEHLIYVGPCTSFLGVDIRLKYQFLKEDVVIRINQNELKSIKEFEEEKGVHVTPDDIEYSNLILDKAVHVTPDDIEYINLILDKAEKEVRLKIVEAWNNYRINRK